MIASDGGGDYYDQRDLDALRGLAERLGYLVAPPRAMASYALVGATPSSKEG